MESFFGFEILFYNSTLLKLNSFLVGKIEIFFLIVQSLCINTVSLITQFLRFLTNFNENLNFESDQCLLIYFYFLTTLFFQYFFVINFKCNFTFQKYIHATVRRYEESSFLKNRIESSKAV